MIASKATAVRAMIVSMRRSVLVLCLATACADPTHSEAAAAGSTSGSAPTTDSPTPTATPADNASTDTTSGSASTSSADSTGSPADSESSDDGQSTGEHDGCDPLAFPPLAPRALDGYQVYPLCGWTVHMHETLYADPLGAQVHAALVEDMQMVARALPASAMPLLQATEIWMEWDRPEFPGAVYHPSAGWLERNGYPTAWAQGIQFGLPNNYLTWVDIQPAMLLHELAHAWDHQRHSFAHAPTLAAFEAAQASGDYESVEHAGGGMQPHYGLNNAAEYFAELTESYFWRNDFYPWERDDLEKFDPGGLAAIEASWFVDE